MTANKNNNKTTEKFDFTDSLKAIKEAAKTVNTQVMEVAEEMTEDIKENSEHLRDLALTPVKKVYGKAYVKIAETVTLENISKTAKDVNAYTLKTAEEMVEGAIVNGEKWHELTTKAVKGGLKLAAKQQAIVFDTLDTVKGQLAQSAIRFRKLFSNN